MPDRKVSLVHRFLLQGKGPPSKQARTNEFVALTDPEVEAIESLYEKSFAGLPWKEEEETA